MAKPVAMTIMIPKTIRFAIGRVTRRALNRASSRNPKFWSQILRSFFGQGRSLTRKTDPGLPRISSFED